MYVDRSISTISLWPREEARINGVSPSSLLQFVLILFCSKFATAVLSPVLQASKRECVISCIPSTFCPPNESSHSATSHCKSGCVAACTGDTPSSSMQLQLIPSPMILLTSSMFPLLHASMSFDTLYLS